MATTFSHARGRRWDAFAVFDTPATAYDRYVGRYGAELAHALAGLAGVAPGMRALDVGCGPGVLTTELVGRLGADHVAAIDPSKVFAEACAARNPGVSVSVGAAEALPYADAEFDCALAQLVVNFMADPVAGVGEMRRVTRPGGTIAAAVWDYAGEMTLIRRFWDAALALDPDAADEAGMPYCTPETLAELIGGEAEPVTVSAGYEGFEDLWAPLAAGVGPAGAYVASLEDAAALKAEFRRRLGVSEKPFRLTARAFIAVGRVPR
jgi:SAM-dependent methyltransferase